MDDPTYPLSRSSAFRAPILERPNTRTTRADDPRESLREAGWSLTRRIPIGGTGFQSLRWSNLRTLLAARDEKIAARMPHEPDGAMRNAWLRERAPDGTGSRAERVRAPLGVSASRSEPQRVLLIGDTGDGSEAQVAVARQLAGRARQPGAAFGSSGVEALLVESDLIYPAGSADEYRKKFHDVYREIVDERIPIYAVPGNHDWNDGSLSGFMATFCGATARPESVDEARSAAAGTGLRSRIARRPLWHDGSRGMLPLPDPPPAQPAQPGPYVALDIGGVLFVGVDTGYGDAIDREQAEWLVATVEAHREMPKILFSGKPLIVNGQRQACDFLAGPDGRAVRGAGGTTYWSIDDVVRPVENGFVAVIGGDVHNYQRYLAHIGEPGGDDHVLPYVVCGGGGVYIGQTAWLDLVQLDEPAGADRIRCHETETVLFPPRAHSRLYLDAIIRQARRRVRFTLPIALGVAGLLGLALWAVHVPAPDPAVDGALLLCGVATNISARPIGLRGRVAAVSTAAVGAALAVVGARHGVAPLGHELGRGATRVLLAAAFGGGQLLLQLGESARLSATRAGRRVGTTISGGAGALLVGASALAFGAASGHGAVPRVVAVVLGALGVASAAATWLLVSRVSVDEAFHDANAVLEGNPPRRKRRRRAVTNWLASNQRRFSIYETFTDGRLTQTASLRGLDGRCYMPLYRSVLEIEFRRDASTPGWELAFTAYAVTGEDIGDTHEEAAGDPAPAPVVVDAFDVRWQPGRLDVDPVLADE
jgi:hypothetical protein